MIDKRFKTGKDLPSERTMVSVMQGGGLKKTKTSDVKKKRSKGKKIRFKKQFKKFSPIRRKISKRKLFGGRSQNFKDAFSKAEELEDEFF